MKRTLTGLLGLSLIFGTALYAQQGGIIFGGGNVTEIINPSSSGTHTLKTGGATIAVDSKGFQIISTGTKPACDATTRDYLWLQRNGVGIADTREVCSKGSDDLYTWKSILTGAAPSIQAAFDVGKTITNANSFANGLHVGASTTTGTRIYEHATLGPQIVPVCAGVENDCDKKVNLNAAKTWELQSQAVAKARFTESTGALEPVGTGTVKANRTSCTGTDYLKADGTCAAPGGGSMVGGRDNGSNVACSVAGITTTGAFFGAASSAADSDVEQRVPVAGAMKQLGIRVPNAVPAGQTLVATVRKAAANTTLTCTIAAAGTSCSDAVNAPTVAVGDLINMQFVCSGGTVALSTVQWTMAIQ